MAGGPRSHELATSGTLGHGSDMSATVSALYRHPVKGFTPEALTHARLTISRAFPGDRLYAVEVGPSGFDPDAPGHVSKMRFAVLARIAAVARIRTDWDEASGLFHAAKPGHHDIVVALDDPADRFRFEAWLTEALGEDATAPLRLLSGEGHRFMDDPSGHVSILNLNSVRDLEARVGQPVDPLRFRANVHVEGLPAWVELDWPNRILRLGPVRLRVVKSIVRCAATHVDPVTGAVDIDLVPELYRLYGHRFCGLYLSVLDNGPIAVGDPLEILP